MHKSIKYTDTCGFPLKTLRERSSAFSRIRIIEVSSYFLCLLTPLFLSTQFVKYILPLLAASVLGEIQQTPTYRWIDKVTGESLVCNKCPPGTYVKTHCTKDRATECETCPQSYYTELWNYIEKCLFCDYPCSADQKETVPCNASHNRVCECKDGYFLKYEFCMRHTPCPPGEGVVRNGTAHRDVECAPCPHGFFSSDSSTTQACQKHSQCPAELIAIPGNSKMDTFCSSCRTDTNTEEGRLICDQEAARFLLQHDIPLKTHNKLVREARRRAVSIIKEASLKDILELIKTAEPSKPLVPVIVEILEKTRLHNLKRKITEWFLVEGISE
ncbi:tumor necrosis factor receptor superfamily member 6B [Chanos chanos]|uniref:Tumor necrosis factor receptor superfamily member 6B n=1 Tax=Chanos chanos TaxID=29144 RepID=A0A6J2WS96_CHACN|nr:tumor necrosis factor receptor superfamily member 6B [Chanos chanos]